MFIVCLVPVVNWITQTNEPNDQWYESFARQLKNEIKNAAV